MAAEGTGHHCGAANIEAAGGAGHAARVHRASEPLAARRGLSTQQLHLSSVADAKVDGVPANLASPRRSPIRGRPGGTLLDCRCTDDCTCFSRARDAKLEGGGGGFVPLSPSPRDGAPFFAGSHAPLPRGRTSQQRRGARGCAGAGAPSLARPPRHNAAPRSDTV